MKFLKLTATVAAIKITTQDNTQLDSEVNTKDATELVAFADSEVNIEDNTELDAFADSEGNIEDTSELDAFADIKRGKGKNKPKKRNYEREEVINILTTDYSKPTAETCGANLKRVYGENQIDDYKKFSTQNTRMFEDPTFPASAISWYWNGMHLESNKLDFNYAHWKRPSQLQTTPPILFPTKREISPAETEQGALGDCWFLAAASALAEYPDRIKALFTDDEYSNVGIFQTKWYIMSEQVKVTIDDRIPVQSSGRPYFANRSPTGAWWLPLLEKSFAKLNVDYFNLDGGWGVDALRMMTNQPCFEYKTRDKHPDEIWHVLSDWDSKKYTITAGTREAVNGLAKLHQYTVIGVVTATYASGYKLRLVKIRNPHGRERYSGIWSDDSHLWTDDLRRQTGSINNKEDGYFFVPIEEFSDNFNEIEYVAYKDGNGWKTSSVKLQELPPDSEVKIALNVASKEEFIIVCDQYYKRLYPDACTDSRQSFSVGQTKGLYSIYNREGKEVGHGSCQGPTIAYHFKLPRGNYEIEFQNRDDEVNGNYALTTYGEQTNKISLL